MNVALESRGGVSAVVAVEHGEILDYVYQPPFDPSDGHHAIAGDHRFANAEFGGPGGDEHIVFLETAGIEQHIEPFACRQLALGVLGVDALLPASQSRSGPLVFKFATTASMAYSAA
jgi:hypothetical protein